MSIHRWFAFADSGGKNPARKPAAHKVGLLRLTYQICLYSFMRMINRASDLSIGLLREALFFQHLLWGLPVIIHF
ncbi:hypothetical protein U14_04869 [Candidatus Moduliflexus flocculans]|uniref:Uncharacterized protein n=1 Tax=Candidatus Moduliflexus flocculans TaxID=1499966 RepID=A0A0S6W627_9BACT|nr:hypothetical protein U14_04869 [Candidatus Moduliflexus flocculans]